MKPPPIVSVFSFQSPRYNPLGNSFLLQSKKKKKSSVFKCVYVVFCHPKNLNSYLISCNYETENGSGTTFSVFRVIGDEIC